jgi:hypothetical protein
MTLPANIPRRGLSLDEAAEYCGIGAKTLQRHGPEPVRIGDRVVYDRVALDAWLDGLICPPAAPAAEAALSRAIHEKTTSVRRPPRQQAEWKRTLLLGAEGVQDNPPSGKRRGSGRDG